MSSPNAAWREPSHRIVAEAADVPLGSMTYHFDGFDDLIFQAFSPLRTASGRTVPHTHGAGAYPR